MVINRGVNINWISIFPCSDHHIRAAQTRSSSENLPFSISRLLSKTYSSSIHNNNNNNDTSDRKSVEKDLSDSENGKVNFSGAGLQYSTACGGLYSYPIYTSGGVLRVPPQRGYNPLTLHHAFPLHPAAALAVKDRLAGEYDSSLIWLLPERGV